MRWVVPTVVALGLALGVAHAGPEVEIRARTQLALARVKAIDAATVEVLGHLRDKLTGTGIAGQRVTVAVGGIRKEAVTSSDGSFTLRMPSQMGQVHIELAYEGGTRLEKADPLTVTTDPTKEQVELALVKIADDPTGARIMVNAHGNGDPTSLPVTLDIAPIAGDRFKPLGTYDTGHEFVLARHKAGGAGMYRLRAQFAGDAGHQPATAIVTVELTSGSTTTMSLSATKLAFEDDLVVSGRVIDDDTSPLAGAAVTLTSGDRRLAQGSTNASGTYRFEIEAELIGHGQFGLQVQADSGASYIKGSRSDPEIVRIAPPQPVPVSYTVAGFVATLLAAGGFFAARSKPWTKLRRPQPPADVPTEEREVEQARGGIVVAKPGVVATLRRANDDGFAGVVRDTVRGRPIGGAIVELVNGDIERSERSAADGSFAIEKLEPGEWRAEVAAPGHVSERFAVSIPHRGELRGVRVDLVPVRERVFQLYRRAAEPVLPEARLWGIWSPRQIVDHVRAKRPSPALAELTDFVEELYFSPRIPEEAVLPQAETRVSRAVNERAQAPR